MKLEELAGTVHSTATRKFIHPKHLLFEIETFTSKTTFHQGNGTLWSSDGWLLTAHHVIEKGEHNPAELIHVYDSYNNRYVVDRVKSNPKEDMAMIHLKGVETVEFSLSFADPKRDEPVYIYSLMRRGTLMKKGSVLVSKMSYVSEHCKDYVDGMAARIRTKNGQSGSLFLNKDGEILGMSVCGPDYIPTRAGLNHASLGPRSDDILKFIRKVYRSQ